MINAINPYENPHVQHVHDVEIPTVNDVKSPYVHCMFTIEKTLGIQSKISSLGNTDLFWIDFTIVIGAPHPNLLITIIHHG
jgi:hypothetical protein